MTSGFPVNKRDKEGQAKLLAGLVSEDARKELAGKNRIQHCNSIIAEKYRWASGMILLIYGPS